MDGSGAGLAVAHDRLGRFVAGHSEYRAKRERIAERVRQLSLDYDASPSQRMLLPIIAAHLDDAERARSHDKRTRATNTAQRLLKLLKVKERPLPTMAEIMSGVK
jgi:hypothetical protein